MRTAVDAEWQYDVMVLSEGGALIRWLAKDVSEAEADRLVRAAPRLAAGYRLVTNINRRAVVDVLSVADGMAIARVTPADYSAIASKIRDLVRLKHPNLGDE